MNKLIATGVQFFKYGLVGILGFAIEFAVFNLFLILIPFDFLIFFSIQILRESISHTISVVVGALFCFVLNKIWTFGNRAHKDLAKGLIDDALFGNEPDATLGTEDFFRQNAATDITEKVKDSAVTRAQLFRYFLLFGFNLMISNALLLLFSKHIGLQLTKVGIMCLLVPWNFIMYRLFVYNPRLDPRSGN